MQRLGFRTEDIDTEEPTGFFYDVDIEKLKKGKKIERTVENTDGPSFDTRVVRDPTESMYKRMFRDESTGQVRDRDIHYAFNEGDNIMISLRCPEGKFEVGDIIKIKVELIL